MKNKWFYLMFVSWLITFLFGYFGYGAYQSERIEDVDWRMASRVPVFGFLLSGLLSGLLTMRWAYGFRQTPDPAEKPSPMVEQYRRSLIFGGVALTGGAMGVAGSVGLKLFPWLKVQQDVLRSEVVKTHPVMRDEWLNSTVSSYRELGATGFRVSDISLGTTQFLRHPDPVGLIKGALDRGVNYIDTSPDYAGADAETAIGSAIAGRPRDELFIATKWCNEVGHIRQGAGVGAYIESVEGSMKRLGTDYIDLVHVHSCDTLDRLLDPDLHEAFSLLRDQGKVRFMGVSTHTPNLEEVMRTAIDSKLFDVMMLAYHHGAWANQEALIREAAAKDIGIVAMKTLKGAKHKGLAEFRPDADAFSQAAFKWVLSNPAVSCLVISFFETQHLDEYLYASGKSLTNQDQEILARYDELIAGTHCFAHCGDCLPSCPSNLPINDILRHRMYFEDYGDQKQAMQLYSRLEESAAACATCAAPCAGVCPSGIDIKARMVGAHEKLSFS